MTPSPTIATAEVYIPPNLCPGSLSPLSQSLLFNMSAESCLLKMSTQLINDYKKALKENVYPNTPADIY